LLAISLGRTYTGVNEQYPWAKVNLDMPHHTRFAAIPPFNTESDREE